MRLYMVTVRVHVSAKKDRVLKYIVMAKDMIAAQKKITAVYPNADVSAEQWNADAILFAQYNEDFKLPRSERVSAR